ncbi:hypothetical protein HZS_4847 [Henneguya salminicola]|nr:hypothetical protein HZS_4847 [Henneguya salminicola]
MAFSTMNIILFHLALLLLGCHIHKKYDLFIPYLKNKKNILNTVFVKCSLGWSCTLMLLFLTADLAQYGAYERLTKILSFIGSSIIIWKLYIWLFAKIFMALGNCVPFKSIKSLEKCVIKGGEWASFDISGHSFILLYCGLLINHAKFRSFLHQQTAHQKNEPKDALKIIVDALDKVLTFFQIIWISMFFITMTSFHHRSEKVVGSIFGIIGYAIVEYISGF